MQLAFVGGPGRWVGTRGIASEDGRGDSVEALDSTGPVRLRPRHGGNGASCSIRAAAPAAAQAADGAVDGPWRRPIAVPGRAARASTGGFQVLSEIPAGQENWHLTQEAAIAESAAAKPDATATATMAAETPTATNGARTGDDDRQLTGAQRDSL